ncbi:hypothetical protein [Pedobacter alpinus]|uniref:Type 1 periplasmic binding fold superfamily protein n=1 Tax=Pedobacter alpinus TaxID=1590643 RepID=A0ABW5TQL0_9SPHI
MKNSFKYLIFAFAIVSISLNACKKDNLPDVDEEELITTISLTFTNTTDATDVKTITYRDLDGDGGNAPVISNLSLKANKVYNVAVTSILNETENPAEDVKEEVEEKKDEHLFVYKTTGANLTFSNFDVDSKNLPVGFTARGTTGAASNGTFTIVLRHQPNGVKNGTETPGSTDLEATFPLAVVN